MVADATNLRLSLRMLLELQYLGLPMMVALNLSDVAAARGVIIDEVALSQALGVPVVKTVAIKRQGAAKLHQLLHEFVERQQQHVRPCVLQIMTTAMPLPKLLTN